MNTFIPKTSGPGRRVSVWADRRFLLPDTTVEPGHIFFSTGILSGLTVGHGVGGVLALIGVRNAYVVPVTGVHISITCAFLGVNVEGKI